MLDTLPVQASTVAPRWDSLWSFMIWISVFFFVLVVGGMIYLAVKYWHKNNARPRYITGNHLLEAIWTIIPTLLLMVIFGWGYYVYNAMTQAPADAQEIRVIGKQWLWTFQYDDGRTTVGEVYVPVNKPIKMIMTSEDVIHSFFVPNFRIKQDVVPGIYTSVWFEATVPGRHQVYCAEYCGNTHSGMLAKVIALEENDWNAWKAGRKLGQQPDIGIVQGDQVAANGTPGAPTLARLDGLAAQGKTVTENKGCIACHTADTTSKLGPSFHGVYGGKVELADGSTVTADDNYIRESIEKPQAKVVKGFNPVMPTFRGLLSEMEMNAVIAYIKSIK